MSLRHAILGFLSITPMSGYELKKAFDETVGHFWTADQAQIYRTLHGLVDAGLVDAVDVPQEGRPNRRDHRLTPAGTSELDMWLRAAPQPEPTREPFLLQLFFAGRLGRADAHRLVADRAAAAAALLEQLKALAAQVHDELGDATVDLAQRLRLTTLDNGIAHARAEVAWATTLADELSDGSTP